MENTSNTKNFVAHGGGEWVIGGKLTFLPGAVVEGGEGLFDGAAGGLQPPAGRAAHRWHHGSRYTCGAVWRRTRTLIRR